jgi:hypothetical protein
MRILSLVLTSGSQRKMVLASVMLIGLTISAFSMSRWAATRLGNAKEQAPAERVKVLHFTLTPLGFNPSVMTVPEGLYVIEVTNRSDLSTFSLNLGHLSNHKLREVNAARTHGEWSGFFRLKSDDYVLAINEKTAWTAKLQVTK